MRHQVDAAHVDQADQADEAGHPDPLRHFGKHRRQVELGQQCVDHRQQQVVQQRRPAHQKPHVRVDRFLGVGIRRTRLWEASHQGAVAQRREQHPEQRQDVGTGDVPGSDAGDDAERVEHGHRGQVGQADDHHVPEAQGFAEMAVAGGAAVRLHGVHLFYCWSGGGRGRGATVGQSGKNKRRWVGWVSS
ncbi:hypothetical protein D3C71_1356410 [compost metagenome]